MEGKHRGRRPGSRNYPLAFKQQVVAEANDPARSIAEVALAHGLNANMISYWRRALARVDAPTPPNEINFVPVRMTDDARHASRRTQRRATSRQQLRVAYARATRDVARRHRLAPSRTDLATDVGVVNVTCFT